MKTGLSTLGAALLGIATVMAPAAAQQRTAAPAVPGSAAPAIDPMADAVGMRWLQEQVRGLGTPIFLSPAGVQQVQQVLNGAGYHAGHLTGTWTEDTRIAAAIYERAHGLEPTGRLTLSLISALNLGTLLTPPVPAGPRAQAAGGKTATTRFTQEFAGSPGVPITLSPAQVRLIQAALNTAGFDAGLVTGIWDQQLTSAVRNYQRTAGLEPNGVADLSLIGSLGLSSGFLTTPGTHPPGAGTFANPQETAGGPGVPLYVSSAGVRLLEAALNNAGFDAGTVDGVWDAETSAAVVRFQAANGLTPSGTLTTTVLGLVDIPEWAGFVSAIGIPGAVPPSTVPGGPSAARR